ncbi:cytochrome P450 [Microbacterium sp. NPDC091313]
MTALRTRMRDDSLSLLVRGYDFGAHIWRRTRPGARAVPFRLLGRPALLVRGSEGVALFYDEDRVRRHGAMPSFIQESLFGHGSVHSLDLADHRHRKAAFVDLLYDDAHVARLLPLLEQEWREELSSWAEGARRTAYDAAVGAFGRAAMRWAGIPGTPAARTRWAQRQAQIVEEFGAPYAPGYLRALANRRWSDRHAARLIEAVRRGELHPEPGTALHGWAWHRDRVGRMLPARLAGVELQNSFRPMIAVSRFVAFAARELHDRPEWRARIAAETADRGTLTGGELATMFAQEIRRTAPFVPLLPAWAVTDVDLDGERVGAGGRIVLDILGTDTDAASWTRPQDFDPERFRGVDDYEALAAFVPHGGGDVASGHRCPGEKLAIAGLASAIAALSDPRVRISGRGLGVNRRRMPTKPRSGVRVLPADAPNRCPFH